ncbi:MAG TPA: HemK/PrmC family methyltransferase [Candidatus Pacearchaeota archaeon]|nr:HemK/PrmC family methyltransferase [Candidatus Pacearchaeota archaeon]
MELPEEYKRGFKDFLGIKIDLSKRPLIPRPETEYWVQWFIKQDHKEKMKCLDLFSGSGCVGVAVLKNIQDSICHFGEIDDAFLEQIKINCNDIDDSRYKIIKTDIFSNINEKYDYILANPPYVAKNRISEVGEDVIEYEPHIALFSGEDGMKAINKFIAEVKNYLNDGGYAIMEFDPQQKGEIKEGEFYKDQFGEYRFVIIRK